MKFVVVIYPDAENELFEIMFHLDKQQLGLGNRFLDEYEKTLMYLENFAEAIAANDGQRSILVGRFSVVLIYLIYQDTVSIRRVIHAARNPKRRYT